MVDVKALNSTISATGLGDIQTTLDGNHVDDFTIPQRKINRKYNCVDCNSFTFEPRTYLEHRKTVHGETITIHECLVCNYASRHPNKVSRHMKMVHHVSSESLNEWKMQSREMNTLISSDHSAVSTVDSKNGNTKIFKCTICNQYDSIIRGALMEHVRLSHPQVDIFHCSMCNYSHYIKDRFRRHVKYHTMEKIHCEKCDFETVYKWNMERHMRHHGAASASTYSCDVCGYAATAKQSITAHKMTHHSQADTEETGAMATGVRNEYPEGKNDNIKTEQSGYKLFVEGVIESGATSSVKKIPKTEPIDQPLDTAMINVKKGEQFDEHLAANCLQIILTEDGSDKDEPAVKSTHSYKSETTGKYFTMSEPTTGHSLLSMGVSSSSNVYRFNANLSRTTTQPTKFSLDGFTIPVFKCPHCPFVVQEISRFHTHIVSHPRTNEYTCSACNFAGKFSWDVRRHIIATHKQANILNGKYMPNNRAYHRNYSEYAETLIITEKALDNTTIVVDVNLKAKNNGEALLIGQYVSLNASLEADNENALDKTLQNAFEINHIQTKLTDDNNDNCNYSKQMAIMRYRCGICYQKSNWKHVIEVSIILFEILSYFFLPY